MSDNVFAPHDRHGKPMEVHPEPPAPPQPEPLEMHPLLHRVAVTRIRVPFLEVFLLTVQVVASLFLIGAAVAIVLAIVALLFVLFGLSPGRLQ